MNGPSLATRGPQVAVAWFTKAREGKAQVRWALSRDAGKTFATPRIVDADAPLGRADVGFLDDGSVVVSWLAGTRADETAEVRVRRYPASGEPDAPVVVATVAAARASGFPRLAALGDRALVAWTDTAGPSIRVALLTLSK